MKRKDFITDFGILGLGIAFIGLQQACSKKRMNPL